MDFFKTYVAFSPPGNLNHKHLQSLLPRRIFTLRLKTAFSKPRAYLLDRSSIHGAVAGRFCFQVTMLGLIKDTRWKLKDLFPMRSTIVLIFSNLAGHMRVSLLAHRERPSGRCFPLYYLPFFLCIRNPLVRYADYLVVAQLNTNNHENSRS